MLVVLAICQIMETNLSRNSNQYCPCLAKLAIAVEKNLPFKRRGRKTVREKILTTIIDDIEEFTTKQLLIVPLNSNVSPNFPKNIK